MGIFKIIGKSEPRWGRVTVRIMTEMPSSVRFSKECGGTAGDTIRVKGYSLPLFYWAHPFFIGLLNVLFVSFIYS